MPSINLIASRREEKKRLEQYTRRLIYAIVGEFGVILVVVSMMTLRLMTVRGDISRLDGQISVLQPRVNDIQNLQTETAKLQPRVNTLNEARNNTLYWYTSLQTVVASLPPAAWLTNISTNGDPTPPKKAPASGGTPAQVASASTSGASLAFTGMAASSEDVGMAMMRMNQFTNINSVTLGGIQQSTAAGKSSAMSFTMTVSLKPNTAQDVPTPGIEAPAQPAAPAAPQISHQAAAVRPADVPAPGGNHV